MYASDLKAKIGPSNYVGHEICRGNFLWILIRGNSIIGYYMDKIRGKGSKMSVFVYAQGIKIVHAGEGVKNGKLLST